jgi:hypothetical protein
MKKQNLKDEPKTDPPKKLSWNQFRDMNLNDIKKIIAVYDRVLIYTIKGDYYELRELEF